eukprot:c47242_g1_i1 orf=381-2426(-)
MGEESDGADMITGPSLGDAAVSKLCTVRETLYKALKKSRRLEDAVRSSSPRLQTIWRSMPTLEAAVAPLRSHKRALHDLGTRIDKAVGPAFVVLKTFDTVHGLEKAVLSGPQCDFVAYITLICRLEGVLDTLCEKCDDAIELLLEMLSFIEQNCLLEQNNIQKLNSNLDSLKAWRKSRERANLDGGLLDSAMDRLEIEFGKLLDDFSEPKQSHDTGKSPLPLPAKDIKMLQMIVERLDSNNRIHRCIELYIERRSRAAKASMQSLQLGYLELSYAELGSKLDWKPLEKFVGAWTQHIVVAVDRIFQPEYHLCCQVFEKLGSEERLQCFSKIAVRGGLIVFLQFGQVVARSSSEPQKLFKLLDMFQAMNYLRPSFTKLFGGQGCKEIQQRTRDLLKLIVQGAYELFLELKQQVELQRHAEMPSDGSIPRVSMFVVGYLRHLVGDFYGPIMAQVLAIEKSWRDRGKMDRDLLPQAVREILKALESSFYERAKSSKEQALFHLFLVNNHWYLYANCKVRELRPVVGDLWLREQQQQAEHHTTLYLKDGWGKIMQHLSIEGVLILTGSRAGARDLLKMRLKAFNGAFSNLYQRHATWSIPDPELREKICLKVVKAIVPAYRTYIQSYGPLMEQDGKPIKYAYTAQTLECMLNKLFQGLPEKGMNGSDKQANVSSAIASATVAKVV